MKLEDIKLVERTHKKYASQLVDLPLSHKLTSQSLKKRIHDRFQIQLAPHTLNYLVKIGIANPHSHDQASTRRFSREDLINILVAMELKDDLGWSYSEILGGLLQFNLSKETIQTSLSPVPHQSNRAMLTVQSRFVANFINWLFPDDDDAISGTIIFIRPQKPNLNRSKRSEAVNIHALQIDKKQVIDLGDDIREDDVIGRVVGNEVLLINPDIKRLRDLPIEKWHKIEVINSKKQDYVVLVSHIETIARLGNIQLPQKDEAFMVDVFEEMLRCLTINVIDTSPKNSLKPNQILNDPYLKGVLSIILNISPFWDYAGVYIPVGEKLQRVLITGSYPSGIYKSKEVKKGDPLVGWAYQYDQHIVINSTEGVGNNLIFRQDVENAHAAIALPTHSHHQLNGVLYVGMHKGGIQKSEKVFSSSKIVMLKQFSDIVGEIIGRSLVRKAGAQHAVKNFSLRLPEPKPVDELASCIRDDLEDHFFNNNYFDETQNIHLAVLKIEFAEGFKKLQPNLANWLLKHTYESAHDAFCHSSKLGEPTVFAKEVGKLDSLIFYLKLVELTDDEDRSERVRIRTLLNSLLKKLNQGTPDQTPFQVLLWSLPFRLRQLHEDYVSPKSEKTILEIAEELTRNVQNALEVVSFVERGHVFEEKGNYPAAVQQYELALTYAPDDIYVKRHLAKCLAACKEYESSIEYWREILLENDNVVHLHRLAHTLALSGDTDAALEIYMETSDRDPVNPSILEDWGDCLFAIGRFEEAKQKYSMSASLLTARDDLDRIEPKIAHAMAEIGEYQKASSKLRLILARNFDNKSARILSIQLNNKADEIYKDRLSKKF